MTSTPAGKPNADPRASALVAAFLEEKRRDSPGDVGPASSGRGRAFILAAVAVICAAAWLVPYPTVDDGAVDPRLESASARMNVFLAATKVQEFRVRHARLPASLAEAGVHDSVLEYSGHGDGSFTLRAPVAGGPIAYDSRQAPHSVLGGAVAIVEGRGR